MMFPPAVPGLRPGVCVCAPAAGTALQCRMTPGNSSEGAGGSGLQREDRLLDKGTQNLSTGPGSWKSLGA